MLEGQTAEESQAELLHRIAVQYLQAMADFYDQTAGSLFPVALRVLGDASEAEEVIQDVFVQIWQKAATFDAVLGSPLHWALSITRHRSIDRLRARHRRARLLDEFQSEVEASPLSGAATSPSALTQDELTAVRAALAGLPEEQRQAIELSFFGGLTHPEIAEATGQPLGTVKARIRRGMLKLRDSLENFI